ncbi:MAG: AAA family ATPase [Burkholderiales bacterium]|nr:AAA family ATPase [Burkholderiales bacterium]
MGTARQDFERFVRWLHEPTLQAPDRALRMANLVLANFEAVTDTVRQHNTRSHLLARLARRRLAGTTADLPDLPEAAPQGQWPWRRLRSLTLGPFRGFREPQTFDLRKRLVLCYGPNGSGKSSLCEALEYALRGAVEEAGSKRIEHRDYLANIHAGRFVDPVLTATDADGREVRVAADEDAFRFFFVEKNRIDNFSRIAATPPGRKTDLIATLFGMDQFNDFASHFNESMDAVLTLGTQIQNQLAARRQALRTDEATRDGEAEQLRLLDQDAADYAAGVADNLTYDALQAMVVGSDEAPSRLQELDAKLRALMPAVTNTSRQVVAELFAAADAAAKAVATSQRGLDARRSQVSFRQLFAAVQALRAEHEDRCPACLTPIADVTSDPFERAEEGLHELEELAKLEVDHDCLRRAASEASRALRAGLRTLEEFLASEGQVDTLVGAYLQALPRNPEAPDWWMAVQSPETDETGATPSLEQMLVVADQAGARDERTREALRLREEDLAEQRRLNDARVWMAQHGIRRAGIVEAAALARGRIAQWEEANTDLIRRAGEEEQASLRDRPIKDAYDSFYGLLERFREQLPGMLMADLNASTMELYNEFNHGDREEDKLADLRLPLTGDGAVDIAFRGHPQRRVNALTALSEGHIRCLGLAILLAKAEAVGAPLIIFDDAINAIDHDHRSGIRAAIFESERFRETQIIVTCHSPEFVKDVENHLPREIRADCQQYVLLHHRGDHQPRVNPDVGSQNYLERARQALEERFDPRDALSYARKSLEMLTDKAWKWLESHRVGNLSVQIEGPGKEPQLRMLCDALRIKLRGAATFAHPSKQPLLDNLNTILGIPEQNLVWTLLNKGTHEEPDRDDFDIHHVQTVLRVLGEIDRLEMRRDR